MDYSASVSAKAAWSQAASPRRSGYDLQPTALPRGSARPHREEGSSALVTVMKARASTTRSSRERDRFVLTGRLLELPEHLAARGPVPVR